MDLLDLDQVEDIGCPTVEKEYGKRVTIDTVKSLYGKCNGHAHLLDRVHHWNLLRKQTEYNRFRFDCRGVCKSVVLWTVLPGKPVFPGDPANVHMEKGHGKNICVH